MGAFQYQALKKSGSITKGILEADSARHARQLLREQGLIPSKIETANKVILKNKSSTKKISAQELALFTRQLATLLAAGIPVEEALRGVSLQTEKDKTRELIIGVCSKVTEGYSLAQALGEYPLAFPELYRATVNSGEQTGKLDIVLEKLADYTEHQQKTKQKIQQALIYPSMMILISGFIISFLLSFVVPKIIEVFSNSGQTLPLMTKILVQLSDTVKNYGIYCLACLSLIIILFKKSLNYPKVRYIWHKFLLKLPLFASQIKSVNVARYVHTFSILFQAGVSVLETMRVSASLLTNQVMRKKFELGTIRVKEGISIHHALKETEFLTPMAVHLIASGEKSGQLAEMMERTALYLDSEVRRLIDTGLTLLEPLIILMMGGVVLFIVLATLLPIFSMEQLAL